MQKTSILIIEDNTDINNLVCEALTKAGYSCTQAFSGTEGLLLMKNESFSLVFLDLMLPGMEGEKVLPQLKAQWDIPVIVMSAKDSIDTKIELLDAGADDYITKPFDIKELVARAGALLRRFSKNTQDRNDAVTYNGLELDREGLSVKVNDTALEFTKHEYKILELLLLNPDKVLSKQEIYDYAWEDFYIGEDKTINVHIRNIRKKLKAVTDTEYIDTVWGVGFRLKK
ncbi:MAG: response regulator transcription factor [Oscillospiraceae bacterium]|nr:response regulator transcription factor [Oscillospiraceae bacterium]